MQRCKLNENPATDAQRLPGEMRDEVKNQRSVLPRPLFRQRETNWPSQRSEAETLVGERSGEVACTEAVIGSGFRGTGTDKAGRCKVLWLLLYLVEGNAQVRLRSAQAQGQMLLRTRPCRTLYCIARTVAWPPLPCEAEQRHCCSTLLWPPDEIGQRREKGKCWRACVEMGIVRSVPSDQTPHLTRCRLLQNRGPVQRLLRAIEATSDTHGRITYFSPAGSKSLARLRRGNCATTAGYAAAVVRGDKLLSRRRAPPSISWD